MKKICFVVSSYYTVNGFLLNHIAALSASHDVSVIANTNKQEYAQDKRVKYKLLSAPIERDIHPLKDAQALVVLVHLFRKSNFNIVHSVSPKAGLLSMSAARLARVPIRVHTFTGQVWVTRTGIMRRLLKQADRVLAHSATHILVDSFSQRDFLVKERIVKPDKTSVLANGSINGVDINRFQPDRMQRSRIRAENNIPDDAILYLFIGRLTQDKGLADLAEAFRRLCVKQEHAYLMIVGRDEERMQPIVLARAATAANRIFFVSHTLHPEHYMAAADVLCLPSYREGFGNVIIEAAATGIPSIASRIYGITDAINEGETGLLHAPGNQDELVSCMSRLFEDVGLRTAMGKKARQRVHRDFSQEVVTDALLQYYNSITARND
ncbi:MAG: glycosyltransferase family 4 protein [Thermoleophilia bacterium]